MPSQLAAIEARIERWCEEALTFARNSPEPDPATVRLHVFANPINPPAALQPRAVGETRTQGWLEAVRDGIAEEMRANPAILYFGEGTGERGGSFAHTKNLWQEFGAERMVDTPISEQGFTAAAVGASATGARTVSDLMFADFAFETAGQIFLQAAKLRYMTSGLMSATDGGARRRRRATQFRPASQRHLSSDLRPYAGPHRLRAVNAGRRQGPDEDGAQGRRSRHHARAQGAVRIQGRGALGEHYVPFGVARIARAGTDITIVAAGQMVQRALEAADALAAEGIEAEIIDPRTIMPLDIDTIVASVRKTHRLLIVDEAWAMCGLGGEIAQAINELAFDELDAPPGRLHTAPTSHPFAPVLERAMLVDQRASSQGVRDVIAGKPPVPDHWYRSA